MTNLPPEPPSENDSDGESGQTRPPTGPPQPSAQPPQYQPPQYQPPHGQPPQAQQPQGQPPQSQPPQYLPPHSQPPQGQPPQSQQSQGQTPQYQTPQQQPPQYQPPQQPQYQQPTYPQQQQSYQQPYQQQQQQSYQQQPQFSQQQPYPHGAMPLLPAPGAGEPFDGAYSPEELNRPLFGASFGQAFIRFFKNYANFSGRASRSEFWWMVLIYAIAFIAIGIVAGVLESIAYGARMYDAVGLVVGLAVFVVFLGSIIPWLAITWRRLHDANLPGPLYFIVFVPYLGSLVLLILNILPPKPEGRRFDRPQRA